ncbi:MAG: DUF4188 domain-containing protein [Flavobacteriales bacterium]|nr:DUF4188 domain-containing protein [Flavobacteriales bacterium]
MSPTHLEPPYYIVTFSYKYGQNLEGYAAMDEETLNAVKKIDGFIGYESVKTPEKTIFISYWRDITAIELWKNDALHLQAKIMGKSQWYQWYHVQIAKVEQNIFHTNE